MSTFVFLDEDMKKPMAYGDSVLKKNEDLHGSKTQLETSVSTLKSDLNKTNLFL